jgi:hypothetical protein
LIRLGIDRENVINDGLHSGSLNSLFSLSLGGIAQTVITH